MEFFTDAKTLDIILIGFFILMILIGIKNKFFRKIYDLATSLLVIFVSYTFCKPVSELFVLVKDNSDGLSMIYAKYLNTIIVFVILYLALTIIKNIIGVFIHSLMKETIEKFNLTSFTDHFLGGVLGAVEGIIIVYLALLLVLSPLFTNGRDVIDKTDVCKHIVYNVPIITDKIQDITTEFDTLQQASQEDVFLPLMTYTLDAYQNGIINKEEAYKIINEPLTNYTGATITLSSSQYVSLSDILSSSSLSQEEKNNLLKKVKVFNE